MRYLYISKYFMYITTLNLSNYFYVTARIRTQGLRYYVLQLQILRTTTNLATTLQATPVTSALLAYTSIYKWYCFIHIYIGNFAPVPRTLADL